MAPSTTLIFKRSEKRLLPPYWVRGNLAVDCFTAEMRRNTRILLSFGFIWAMCIVYYMYRVNSQEVSKFYFPILLKSISFLQSSSQCLHWHRHRFVMNNWTYGYDCRNGLVVVGVSFHRWLPIVQLQFYKRFRVPDLVLMDFDDHLEVKI